MAASHADKPKWKRGLHLGPIKLLILAILVVGCLVAAIVLGVYFGQSGTQIKKLEAELAPFKTTRKPVNATTGAPVVHNSYRLPKDIIPSHYDLYLHVVLPFTNAEVPDPFTTSGKVTIDIECLAATNVIILNAKNMTIDSIRLTPEQSLRTTGFPPIFTVLEQKFDPVHELLQIELNQKLLPGRRYQLYMEFKGEVSQETHGLYRSQYKLPNGDTRHLAATQFQPTHARSAFPCFDEPAMRATFDVTLKHDTRFTGTYSNGAVVTRTPVPGATTLTETRFRRTFNMPVYLLAFLISDYEQDHQRMDGISDGLDFGVIARKEKIGQAKFAKDVGMAMTDFTSKLFDRSFLAYNSKLDMVAVPTMTFAGMENWGLVLYLERLIMYTPGVSPAAQKVAVAEIVAHELAHQWFGNPVTTAWWSDLFLNEGFATHLVFPMVAGVCPRWQLEKLYTIDVTRTALNVDAVEASSVPLSHSVNTPDEIWDRVDSISYQKGAAVIRMIEGTMGSDNFYEALRTYLDERTAEGGSTIYPLLLRAFTEHMRKATPAGTQVIDYREHFEEWITTSGFPLVTVTVSKPESKFRVTQERYLSGTPSSPAATLRKWSIPVTYITKATSETPTELLARQTKPPAPEWFTKYLPYLDVPVPAATNWVLANIQNYGYYRVNYDNDNWKALAEQLESVAHEGIHLFSRVQLIEDAYTLARKGVISYDVPIRLIRYIHKEQEYPPWSSANVLLNHLQAMIGDFGNGDALSQFVRDFVAKAYQPAGGTQINFWDSSDIWNENDVNGEKYQELSRRMAIMETTCYHDQDTCVGDAQREFRNWKTSVENNDEKLNPNFKDLIWCYGLRAGSSNAADQQFLFSRYIFGYDDTDPVATSANRNVLKGLGCVKDAVSMQSVLGWIFELNKIKSKDVAFLFQSASKFPTGNSAAWEFIRAPGNVNWNRLPVDQRKNIIATVAGKFNTQVRLDEVTAFALTLGTDFPEKEAFDQVKTTIQANIKWLTDRHTTVREALYGRFET